MVMVIIEPWIEFTYNKWISSYAARFIIENVWYGGVECPVGEQQ